MPLGEAKVHLILSKNKAMLIDFIEKFQNDRDEDDFYLLKGSMVKKLQDLVWYNY